MHVLNTGTVDRFSRVPSGACCVFKIANRVHLELKYGSATWAVVLAPGHPEADGLPGLYQAHLAGMNPVFYRGLPRPAMRQVQKVHAAAQRHPPEMRHLRGVHGMEVNRCRDRSLVTVARNGSVQ
jgi:hypothetical protein